MRRDSFEHIPYTEWSAKGQDLLTRLSGDSPPERIRRICQAFFSSSEVATFMYEDLVRQAMASEIAWVDALVACNKELFDLELLAGACSQILTSITQDDWLEMEVWAKNHARMWSPEIFAWQILFNAYPLLCTFAPESIDAAGAEYLLDRVCRNSPRLAALVRGEWAKFGVLNRT